MHKELGFISCISYKGLNMNLEVQIHKPQFVMYFINCITIHKKKKKIADDNNLYKRHTFIKTLFYFIENYATFVF